MKSVVEQKRLPNTTMQVILTSRQCALACKAKKVRTELARCNPTMAIALTAAICRRPARLV